MNKNNSNKSYGCSAYYQEYSGIAQRSDYCAETNMVTAQLTVVSLFF